MENITSRVNYLGLLRTESTHIRSGEKYITDAPIDNNGQGAYFSPTDLVATGLANCMLTLMGIAMQNRNIDLGKIGVDVTKIMGSDPRRIVEIVVKMKIENMGFDDKTKRILEQAALTCPVAKSLHPDIKQQITFEYY